MRVFAIGLSIGGSSCESCLLRVLVADYCKEIDYRSIYVTARCPSLYDELRSHF